jgi:hypothetical protein
LAAFHGKVEVTFEFGAVEIEGFSLEVLLLWSMKSFFVIDIQRNSPGCENRKEVAS